MKKYLYVLLAFAVLVNFAIAQGGLSSLSNALSTFCTGVRTLVPIAAMLMVVGAGALYAAGQIMGAETRARANVWATAMLTGAIIGILIVVLAPSILQTIYSGGTGSINC